MLDGLHEMLTAAVFLDICNPSLPKALIERLTRLVIQDLHCETMVFRKHH